MSQDVDWGKRYPLLFNGQSYPINADWGWFELVDGLCNRLEQINKRLPKGWVFRSTQIKEKFGSLRFYYLTEGEFGSDIPPEIQSILDEAERLILDAEAQSLRVCETCGEIGSYRGDLGWVSTLCEPHYLERKSTQDKYRAGIKS